MRNCCVDGGSKHCLYSYKNDGDGSGFFLACEHLGRIFDQSFPACAFFVFVFEVGISSHSLIPLFMPDQSTLAQGAEKTVAE